MDADHFGKFRGGIVTSETSQYPAETSKMLFHETKSYLPGSCDITEGHPSNRRQVSSHPKCFHTYQHHPVLSATIQGFSRICQLYAGSTIPTASERCLMALETRAAGSFRKSKASWQLLS